MNFTEEEKNTLLRLENKINSAIRENNALKVAHYCNSKDFIETNILARRLIELNMRGLSELITYLQVKLHLIEIEMEEYEREN